MKLVTYHPVTETAAAARIGVLVGEYVVDLGHGRSIALGAPEADTVEPFLVGDMLTFLEAGHPAMDAANTIVDFFHPLLGKSAPGEPAPTGLAQACLPISTVRLLAPVPRPRSIRDTISFEGHAKNFEKRSGKPVPAQWYERPFYYKGNPGSVIGHDADVIWPTYTDKLDYELEFGIYIGRKGANIRAEAARDYIAGYTIFNDISARDVIEQEIRMMLGPAKGKDMDTGNVMGPCLVTPDELDPSKLEMTARVNGEVWSSGNSADMYWRFEDIIEFVSDAETLYPGDFIGSGTIANGCGDELDRWLRPGDVVELEVEGIGVLRNRIVKP